MEDAEEAAPVENKKALIAYHCGLWSFVPVLGLPLAPLALIFGAWGIAAARAYPKGAGSGHAVTGIVLGLMGPWTTVIVVVLLKLGILVLPWNR